MTKQDLKTLVAQTEMQYGIPAGILDRLVQLESSYNPNAYNQSSGASGLTQIIRRYHPAVNNPFDPYEALAYTGRTLRQYFEKFGHWQSAVAAWHAGEPAVTKALAQGKLVPGTVDSVTGLPTTSYAARIVGNATTTTTATNDGYIIDAFDNGWTWKEWTAAGVIGLLLFTLITD
jgi:soluble lytic murein transglycosylase-like protein